jgi:hypothetical protein
MWEPDAGPTNHTARAKLSSNTTTKRPARISKILSKKETYGRNLKVASKKRSTSGLSNQNLKRREVVKLELWHMGTIRQSKGGDPQRDEVKKLDWAHGHDPPVKRGGSTKR